MSSPPASRFHTLATVSVLAIPLSFLVGFLSNISLAIVDPSSKKIVALVTATTIATIMLIGFISGVVALFGIPRYGGKGILTKSLLGILIPILLIGLAAPALYAAKHRANLHPSQGEISAGGGN